MGSGLRTALTGWGWELESPHGVHEFYQYQGTRGVWTRTRNLRWSYNTLAGRYHWQTEKGRRKSTCPHQWADLDSLFSHYSSKAVGAGHVGLMVAARFKQMNIPTLAIDQLPRLGDKWRNRYESLTLHTTRTHDQCRCLLHPQSKSLTSYFKSFTSVILKIGHFIPLKISLQIGWSTMLTHRI